MGAQNSTKVTAIKIYMGKIKWTKSTKSKRPWAITHITGTTI